ncbi:Ribokinase-like protein [Meredithblackwellia eburnea MCA 4105]
MSKEQVKVASLGLFILDTFEFRNEGKETIKREESVVGGGGTYAIVGARMWLPPTKIGIVVDRGTDFPVETQRTLDGMGEMWHYRDQDRPTTRALNLYTGDHRDFEYLNERQRLEPIDFPPSLRTATWLHFVCSPTRSLVINSQLTDWHPNLAYEPIPDRCTPAELPSLRNILPHLAVFSPNHEEAWAFFGKGQDEVKEMGKKGIEEVAMKFFEEGAEKDVVIRSGALGAYVVRKGQTGIWVPAYHTDATKVIDVTGAGNSFMGGLMAGLELHPDNLVLATQMAAVSASFIIEQYGLATLSTTTDGIELWNGASPIERLEEMKKRGTA